MTKIILNIDEIIPLIKTYRRKYAVEENQDDYAIGVTQGLDFTLWLLDHVEE